MNEIPFGYCHCGCGEITNLAPKTSKKQGWIQGEPCKFINGHNRKVQIVPVHQRFWSKVAITANPDKCWEWQARLTENGYGHFYMPGQPMVSNRVAWQLTKGDIPEGLFVLHSCDNRKCCNPAHLFLGTQAENVHDMFSKGRGAVNRFSGEANGSSKLTAQQVQDIRKRYAAGGISLKKISQEYAVSEHTVWSIVNFKTWLGVLS